jgi:hypothetical protein
VSFLARIKFRRRFRKEFVESVGVGGTDASLIAVDAVSEGAEGLERSIRLTAPQRPGKSFKKIQFIYFL